MQFAREKLHIPLPKVLAYCSQGSKSKLGAEYIAMEKAPGIELDRVWDNLMAREKISVVEQVSSITCRLALFQFPCYGALYRRQDISVESQVIDDEFAVGPTVGREWFDDRRGDLDVPRGPWSSAESVMEALVQREIACLRTFTTFPQDCQKGIYGGPGGYHPSHKAKLSVLQDFLKIYRHIIPHSKGITGGIIWHNDLYTDNIFVDQDNPSQITSIIDWQGVPIYPMFLAAHHPSLIEHDGPKLDGFVQPTLPENFDSLDPEARKSAKDLFVAQSCWLIYEIEVQKAIPELLWAFRYRDSLPGHILGTIGSIYDDGEPYMQTLLADLSEESTWKQVVGTNEAGHPNVPCPLHYSQEEISRQQMEYSKWQRDVERKARVMDEMGAYPGWNGAVSPNEYDEVARRLSVAKQNFLLRESADEQESVSWEKVWPFRDAI